MIGGQDDKNPIPIDYRSEAALQELDTRVRLWCQEWGLTDYLNAPRAFRARVNLYMRFGLHYLGAQQPDFDMAFSVFYSVVDTRAVSALTHPVLAAACILYCARLATFLDVGLQTRVQICKAFTQCITQEEIEDNYMIVLREYQNHFINMTRPGSQRKTRDIKGLKKINEIFFLDKPLKKEGEDEDKDA